MKFKPQYIGLAVIVLVQVLTAQQPLPGSIHCERPIIADAAGILGTTSIFPEIHGPSSD